MNLLVVGFITGFIFGFLLHKAQVVRYDKQVGALLFEDFTIFKFMFSAIVTAMVLLWLFNDLGWISVHPKPLRVWANLLGGTIFGIGWGLLGYCPGTTVCAVAEGRLDGLFGMLGMVVGAVIYADYYPFFRSIRKIKSFGRTSLEDLTGVNHWILIIVVAACMIGMLYLFEKMESKKQ